MAASLARRHGHTKASANRGKVLEPLQTCSLQDCVFACCRSLSSERSLDDRHVHGVLDRLGQQQIQRLQVPVWGKNCNTSRGRRRKVRDIDTSISVQQRLVEHSWDPHCDVIPTSCSRTPTYTQKIRAHSRCERVLRHQCSVILAAKTAACIMPQKELGVPRRARFGRIGNAQCCNRGHPRTRSIVRYGFQLKSARLLWYTRTRQRAPVPPPPLLFVRAPVYYSISGVV